MRRAEIRSHRIETIVCRRIETDICGYDKCTAIPSKARIHHGSKTFKSDQFDSRFKWNVQCQISKNCGIWHSFKVFIIFFSAYREWSHAWIECWSCPQRVCACVRRVLHICLQNKIITRSCVKLGASMTNDGVRRIHVFFDYISISGIRLVTREPASWCCFPKTITFHGHDSYWLALEANRANNSCLRNDFFWGFVSVAINKNGKVSSFCFNLALFSFFLFLSS